MQLFLIYLFISTDALHVSGSSSSHHQEHITVCRVSGIVNQYCDLLLSLMLWNMYCMYSYMLLMMGV